MKILLLGSGELGKEVVISAQRLGHHTIAVDSYAGAPAMQVADAFEVINMLDGEALAAVVGKHQPDIIVPEIEAIRTEKLQEFEASGIFVVPTAQATYFTMNRDAIRDLAAKELNLKTAKYHYASDLQSFRTAVNAIGIPCVAKPVMSSSGKGQSVIRNSDEIDKAWEYALADSRGDTKKVIVEEFIPFEFEITLLTVKQKNGPTLFVKPIGHRQERGDYQESWCPMQMDPKQLEQAQDMAQIVTDRLGGAGLFGVEFFVTKDSVYFSELSPRPHDTGMVTMIGQNLSEFELHVRAILGLPIPQITYAEGAAASAVILAKQESSSPPIYQGIEDALSEPGTDIRIFGKPSARKYRRMGVALATGKNEDEARTKARRAAAKVKLTYK